MHRRIATRLALTIPALLITAFALSACAGAAPANALCTCAADEKYNGTECVAAASFTAPANCTPDNVAVCGCDEKGYTSTCAAYAVGVEVQYAGTCHASSGSSGGGFGW